MRRLAQVEAAGDDIAEHEALDPELVGAVLLGEKPDCSSVERSRNAVARGMPVRLARSASDSRGSRNEKTLRSSSALAAASTV